MKKKRIDIGKRNHNFVAMKKVTVVLADDPARRVRIAAAKEDKSLSHFVADLLKERCCAETAKNWPCSRNSWMGKGSPASAKLGPAEKFFMPNAKTNCCGAANLPICATDASDHKLAPNFELSR
jgi:hypothetical protein